MTKKELAKAHKFNHKAKKAAAEKGKLPVVNGTNGKK